MAGPWEKFKKSEKSGQKPWEKFQKTAENEQKTMVSEPSSDFVGDAEAGLQGFGQGATLGYMPQIQAAIEPAVSKVGDLITGSDTYSDLPDYAARRDQWAKLQQQLAEKHPKSYLGGQLGGGLTTALAVPGAALAKGAGLGLKTAASVGTGAAYRGLMNPGDVEGEVNPLQLKERGMAVADPLALGIDAAIPGAGAAATKIAETKAFKAIGPYARDSMKAFGADKVRDIGRTVLDSEAFGWIPKGYEALAERLSALKNKSGKQLGDTVEQMAQKETGVPISLNREEIAKNLEQKLISSETDAAGVANRNAKMQENIANFKQGGLEAGAPQSAFNDNIPLLDAELKKRNLAKEINWDRLPGADIPDNEAFNRELLTQLRSGVEQGGEQLAKKTGYDVNKFKTLKNEYGNLAAAESIADKRAAKEFANRLLSPSDYGTGLIGAGIGFSHGGSPEERMKHAAMGASLGLVNKGARLYGNQITARTMNRVGQGLGYAAQNPLVTQGALSPMSKNTWKTLYDKKENKK